MPSPPDDDAASNPIRLMTRDAIDALVIEQLASGECRALERVSELERENMLLREIVSVALGQLASATAHLDVARRTIRSGSPRTRRHFISKSAAA